MLAFTGRGRLVAQPLVMLMVAALSLAVACARPGHRALDIATTTSVQNSGLLNHLLPLFEQATGLAVRVHAAGSGRALRMLADGMADAVISHAPEAEERMLAEHADWQYRKIAHNWFVVGGPAHDPAGVRAAADAVDGFRRIARSGEPFVSRGDQSGTHEREQSLWAAAGVRPVGGKLIVSGAGMAQALRHANEARAYVLTDAPTLWQLAPVIDLDVLLEGDPRLINTYAVVHVRGQSDAAAFAAWLTGDDGRAAVESFTIAGRHGFQPWPAGCAGEHPRDLPCHDRAK